MRHERKYRIESIAYEEVLRHVMTLPRAFSESYPDRWVNSIYLDDILFNALNQNLDGNSNRSKFRLRWYGVDIHSIHNPVLEEKVKRNKLGYKNNKQLSSIVLEAEALKSVLNESEILDKNLFPKVLVRYQRTYLESFDHRVRITIDRNLNYFGFNGYHLNPFATLDDAVIVEVKYSQDMDEEMTEIFQALRFRLSKNSKYVSAVESFWA